MKAVVYDKKNSPQVLSLREVDQPAPGAGQVRVKIITAGINAADYRSMAMGIIPASKIFGADVAGVVESAGSDARRFQVGDAVFGDLASAGFGGFAEYVAAPENLLALKPAGVSFEQAAAVPMAALTALQGLRDLGHLQPGEKVLIYGAGGGVGTFAVQLARVLGGQVTAVCGPANAENTRSLGADRVVDYTREDITRSGEQFDLVLAVNGRQPLRAYRRLLAPGGRCIMAGGALAQILPMMVFGPLLSLGSKKLRLLSAKASPRDLEYVIQLVAEGRVKPVIDRVYPLARTAEAVDYARQGHACGKVLIAVAPPAGVGL